VEISRDWTKQAHTTYLRRKCSDDRPDSLDEPSHAADDLLLFFNRLPALNVKQNLVHTRDDTEHVVFKEGSEILLSIASACRLDGRLRTSNRNFSLSDDENAGIPPIDDYLHQEGNYARRNQTTESETFAEWLSFHARWVLCNVAEQFHQEARAADKGFLTILHKQQSQHVVQRLHKKEAQMSSGDARDHIECIFTQVENQSW
jgi:hypothetical protein